MPCDCDRYSSCPICCCDIEVPKNECKIKDLNCVLKVATDVQKACVGGFNLYLIKIIVKNCTRLQLTNFNVHLSLGCSLVDLPLVKANECSPVPCSADGVGNVLGIIPYSEDTKDCLLLKPCIEALPYKANLSWDGSTSSSLIANTGTCGLRLSPGETCISVRFFAPNTASLISPCVSVCACVPCCGPVRVVKILKADCAPCLVEKPFSCFLECPPVPLTI